MAASKFTRAKRVRPTSSQTVTKTITTSPENDESSKVNSRTSKKSEFDLRLERIYGGPRPPRVRSYKTCLRSTPTKWTPSDACDLRGLLPFISHSGPKLLDSTNYWDPGPPPIGMSEERWGERCAAAFMEFMWLEAKAGRTYSFAHLLSFIRYNMGKSLTLVETGFWNHLVGYLLGAVLAHPSQEAIAGMAALDFSEKKAAIKELLNPDR